MEKYTGIQICDIIPLSDMQKFVVKKRFPEVLKTKDEWFVFLKAEQVI